MELGFRLAAGYRDKYYTLSISLECSLSARSFLYSYEGKRIENRIWILFSY